MRKMTILEAAKNVDRSKENSFDYVDTQPFSDIFGLNCYYGSDYWNRSMIKHFIAPWYCTDTWVGWSAYYLEDKLVAISWQSGRKSDEHIYFISKESAEKVRKALIDEIEEDIPLIDPEEEFEFKIDFNGNILDREKENCYLNGEKVVILNCDRNYKSENNYGISRTLSIQKQDGEVLDVQLHELTFGLRVKRRNNAIY